MSDVDSSLPQRTRANTDVVVGVADPSAPANTQQIDADRHARTASRLIDSSGTEKGTPTNPLVVEQTTGVLGDPIADHDDSGDLAKNATANHDYTVNASKIFLFKGIEGSASDRSKWEIQIETGVAADTWTSHGVIFNSVANPNCDFEFKQPMEVTAGIRVRVIQKSLENPGHSVYSSIMGVEIDA